MNIKYISLLLITIAINAENMQEKRIVKNLEEIKVELEIAKKDVMKAYEAAQKSTLWIPFRDAAIDCWKTRSCHKNEDYQALLTQWIQTGEGNNLRYHQMKIRGLDKISCYIESARLNHSSDEIGHATSGIYLALYVDTTALTDEEKEMRRKVEAELCTLLQTDTPLSEIIAELERKKR